MDQWFDDRWYLRPLGIVVVVAVAFVASRVARWVVRRSMRTPAALRRAGDGWSVRAEARYQTLSAVLQSLAAVAVWFVAVVAVLEVLSLDLGPLIATAGIAGVALGFGAQNVVRDFLAGFFMVVEDQLGVGDVVDLGPPVKGTVEKVTLRSTRVRGTDGTLWHVPNGQVLRVGNLSQEWARAVLDVVVAYDTDVDAAIRVVGEVAAELRADRVLGPEVTDRPEVWGVEDLTSEGVVIRLVVKTSPGAQWKVLRELRRRLLVAFPANGVRLPHADLTVHLTDDEDPPSG